jgi:hypothetical protein
MKEAAYLKGTFEGEHPDKTTFLRHDTDGSTVEITKSVSAFQERDSGKEIIGNIVEWTVECRKPGVTMGGCHWSTNDSTSVEFLRAIGNLMQHIAAVP